MDRNTLLGLAAVVLWSTSVALARSISEQIGPLTAGATVNLIAGLFLTFYCFLRERSFRKLQDLPRLYLFGCGALFVIYMAALYLALGLATDRRQTIEVGLLNYLWPTLTVLFSLFILGKRTSLVLIPATLLALCGVFLVLTPGASLSWNSFLENFLSNPAAYSLGLLAAVSWGLYSNLTRRWSDPAKGGAVMLFTLATGITLLLIRVLHTESTHWSIRATVEVALFSLAMASAYAFWDIAMRKGDVVLVAVCSYLTPFLSTVVSCLYLRVLPGITLWFGCVLIIAGSLLSWRSIRQEDTEERPEPWPD